MRVIEIVVFISCLPFTKRGTKPTAEKVDFLSAEKHRARALNVASRCIRNVMLILRRTACRTVAAFQESLASGAALTMIRPRHDGGGVTGHQGFTEATDRYTTSLSHGFLARFTSVRSTLPPPFFPPAKIPRLCYGDRTARTYVPPICKCTSVYFCIL